MGNKKKTRIILETERIFVLNRSDAARMLCADCGHEVYAVGMEEAALLTGLSVPTIRRRVEARTAHLIEISAPQRICLNSLLGTSS